MKKYMKPCMAINELMLEAILVGSPENPANSRSNAAYEEQANDSQSMTESLW